MNAEHERLKEVLAEAVAKGGTAERAAYLDTVCQGDAPFRARVDRLLGAHDRAGDFLNTPVEFIQADFVVEPAGARIGDYKLLEKIGEGGFGVVYLAEQVEPVQCRVALKIIKPGMDTREVVARFEAERQALALMNHPSIAKVLGGGTTRSQRPYFVMELVRGIPLTEYCDRNRLSTTERLRLLMKVCQAVQHAHQKGIIHRDLKPANVLVTVGDSEPLPKVIDFGVAKALGQKLTKKTLFTSYQQVIGTLAYMSSEQAGLGGLDIDTRSDIYSLGALLYELLTGVTPFDAERLHQLPLDEARRVIREEEPPKPSTRLQTLGDKLAGVAKCRRAEPRALAGLLRGDLDWIVMKCLEKDRTRRYESANDLALDLRRHLNQEPVTAAAPSTLYRAGKFIRRYKLELAAAAALVLLLAAGTVVSAWQAVRATRAEDKLQVSVTALQEIIRGLGPPYPPGFDPTPFRKMLDITVERLRGEFTNQPQAEVELLRTVADVYYDLGLWEQSEHIARERLRLAGEQFGEENLVVASALYQVGQALWRQQKLEAALPFALRALELRQRLLGHKNPEVADSLSSLANIYYDQDKLAEAEPLHRLALQMRLQLLGPNHPDVAKSLNNLGNVLWKEEKLTEAESTYRRALDIRTSLWGYEHPDVAISLNNLANVLFNEGKAAEAEAMHRQALKVRRELLGNLHPDVTLSVKNLVFVLLAGRKYAETEALFNDLLTPAAVTQPQSAGLLLLRGKFLARTARWTAAAADFAQVIGFEPDNHEAYHSLAPLRLQLSDFQGYRQQCQQEVAQFRDTDEPLIAERVAKDCLLRPDSGADPAAVTAWADLAVAADTNHWAWPHFQFIKGFAAYRQGDFAGAVTWLRKTLATEGGQPWRDAEAYAVLAMAQQQLHLADAARAALAQGLAIAQTKLPQLESGDLGVDWLDWIVAHTLLREAQALIQAPAAADQTAAPANGPK